MMSKWLVGNATIRIYIVFAMHSAITVLFFFGVNTQQFTDLNVKLLSDGNFNRYTYMVYFFTWHVFVGIHHLLTVKRCMIWSFAVSLLIISSNSHEIPAFLRQRTFCGLLFDVINEFCTFLRFGFNFN